MADFPILKKNHASGELVEELQQILKIPITGIFDDNTEAAVKAWQQKNAIYSNGIVDQQSWDKLHEDCLNGRM